MSWRTRLATLIAPELEKKRETATVVVDGVSQEVAVTELVRSYQKNRAADNRLRAATKVLRKAQAT